MSDVLDFLRDLRETLTGTSVVRFESLGRLDEIIRQLEAESEPETADDWTTADSEDR